MDVGIEERKAAIEAIATLVHMRDAMAELILKPAGISPSLYQPFLNRYDSVTKRPLSKRKLAPLLLDAVEKQPNGFKSIHTIVKIAANWSSYHLASDERQARMTVQWARDVLHKAEKMAEQEAEQREKEREEERINQKLEREKQQREQEAAVQKQFDHLLMMFDHLALDADEQIRGYQLEQLLNLTFQLCNIPIYEGSFRRNQGGEQIDGAFRFDGWFYLVECKWRSRLADISPLDGLKGKVDRSGKQAMGLFLSINGWTKNVPQLLKLNSEKSIILMDGLDLRGILSRQASLDELLLAKLTNLTLRCEPYIGIRQYLKELEKIL